MRNADNPRNNEGRMVFKKRTLAPTYVKAK